MHFTLASMHYSEGAFTRLNYDEKEITKTTYKDYNGSAGSLIVGGTGKQNVFVISVHPRCGSTCPCESIVCAFLCCNSEMTSFLSGQHESLMSIEGPHLFCLVKGKDFITIGKTRANHSKKITKTEIHSVTSPGIYYIDATNKLKTSLKFTTKFHPIFMEWLIGSKSQYNFVLNLFSELLNIGSNKNNKNPLIQNCDIIFSCFFLSNSSTSVLDYKIQKSVDCLTDETPIANKDQNGQLSTQKKRKLSFDS